MLFDESSPSGGMEGSFPPTLEERLEGIERRTDRLVRDIYDVDPIAVAGTVTGLPGYIAALMAQGRKIEAIIAYREKTGADLATAQAEVERGMDAYATALTRIEQKLDLLLQRGAENAPPRSLFDGPNGRQEMDWETIAWIRKGSIIAAIAEYRKNRPGCGLKEAKDAVDAWIAANGDR